MKKLLTLILLLALFLAGMAASQFFIVNKTDGSQLYFAISEVDSISFYDPQEHDYVDLGLPSGTMWATCNLGADSPEEDGDYFAWGETTPKSNYNWSNYKYGSAANQLTKYCNKSSYGLNGFTDGKTVLDASDDAARVNLGENWRMPTLEEMNELWSNCTHVRTTINGKVGCLFTGPNGNTLFFPGAGQGLRATDSDPIGVYWTNSLYSSNASQGACFGFNWTLTLNPAEGRCNGRSIRPVVNR